jgi:hypothetical protein
MKVRAVFNLDHAAALHQNIGSSRDDDYAD